MFVIIMALVFRIHQTDLCVNVIKVLLDQLVTKVRNKGKLIFIINIVFRFQELGECLSNPCANNGTCTDLENGFLCHCLPGWNGTLCTEARGKFDSIDFRISNRNKTQL